MKILKHGKTRKYIFECDKCGCVFQINHEELTNNTYLDVNYTNMTIKRKELILCCPECGATLNIYY